MRGTTLSTTSTTSTNTTITITMILTTTITRGTTTPPDHAEEGHDAHDDDHDDHDDHEHDDHEHDDHEHLSEQTLKTLGVVVEPIRLTDHVRTIDVRGVLVDRPENTRTVVTPIGGIVRAVYVESGEVVEAGEKLLGFTRDPIPLSGQESVLGMLRPVREVVHEAVSTLRSAHTELEIADGEIVRIRGLEAQGQGKIPDLFASRLVELGYARDRAARKVANAEAELEHHGFGPEEIQELAQGRHAPPMLDLWRRLLRKHGIWGELEETILARLPEGERDKPWPIALLAELGMQGLTTPALLELLEAHPPAALRFREVAALLLEGRPIESVALVASMGALEADVVIRSPAEGASHWDVERLLTKVGQSLEAGGPVAELHDPRRLWLRLEPIGGEIAHVRRAVREHLRCRARPVLPGSAPDLSDVHLRRLAPYGDHGTVAYAEIENEILHQEANRRSWSLHAGTEFLVRVPLETMTGRFVLPVDAVIRSGPDRVVYVQEDDEFHAVPVHVELDTDDAVVVAADSALAEGELVVVGGAFALHLALQRGKGGNDVEHGHSHH